MVQLKKCATVLNRSRDFNQPTTADLDDSFSREILV